MPGAILQFPYAILLALTPAPGEPGRLPGGDDPAFRSRMMDWSAATAAPRAQPAVHHVPAAALPRLSSRFGYRGDPIRGGRAMHAGIDIPGPLGSDVRAAEAGIVRFAGVAGGYGNMIEIAHAGGVVTRYGHLSRMLVRPGAQVGQGEVIALMGSTGRSTGSHLHFEVRRDGQAMDPLRVLGRPAANRAPDPLPLAAPTEPVLSAFARARLGRMPGVGIK